MYGRRLLLFRKGFNRDLTEYSSWELRNNKVRDPLGQSRKI
jgi:hypothetical protein